MTIRIVRAILAVLAGVSVSVMVTASPASAGFVASAEIAFTGQLLNSSETLSYCGVGNAQIGDLNDQTSGAVFTRAALFYGACSLASTTTLAPGWLGVKLQILRNGSFCGGTDFEYSSSFTSLWGITGTLCSNPAGWQEWKAVGTHLIFSQTDSTYAIGSSISPWQLY
jgi:hypothetical protein